MTTEIKDGASVFISRRHPESGSGGFSRRATRAGQGRADQGGAGEAGPGSLAEVEAHTAQLRAIIARPYHSEAAAALPTGVTTYNTTRAHGAKGGRGGQSKLRRG